MTVRVIWLKAVLSVVVLNVVLAAKVVPASGPLVPLKHVQGNVFEVGSGPGPYQITNEQMAQQKQEDTGGSFMDFLTDSTQYLASMFLGSSSSSSETVTRLPPPGPARRRPRPNRIPGRPPGPPFARGPRFPSELRRRHPYHPALYQGGPFGDPGNHHMKSKDDNDGHWTGGFSSHFKLFEKESTDKEIVEVSSDSNGNTALGKDESLDVTVNEIDPQRTLQNAANKRETAEPVFETAAADKSFTVQLPLQTIDTRGADSPLPRLETFGITDVGGNPNSQFIRSKEISPTFSQNSVHRNSFSYDFKGNTDISANANSQFSHFTEVSPTSQSAHQNSFSPNFKSSPKDNSVIDDKEIVQKWEQWGALVGKRPTKNSIRRTTHEGGGLENTVPNAPTTLQTIYNNMVSLHKSLSGTPLHKPTHASSKDTQTTQDKPEGFFQGSYSVVKAHDHIDNIDDAIRQNFFGNSASPQYIPSESVSQLNIFRHIPNNNRFTNTAQVKNSDSGILQLDGVKLTSPSRYNQNSKDQFQNSESKEHLKGNTEKGKLHSVADVVDALKIVADALENTAEGEKIYLTKFARDILHKNEHRRSDTDISDTDDEASSYTSYNVEPVNFVDLTAVNGNGDHLSESSYSELR